MYIAIDEPENLENPQNLVKPVSGASGTFVAPQNLQPP